VAGAELAPGEYVFLEVRDDGAGMTPEVQARIFDPFFSTKASGRGLGLAAVLGIVRGHQGALRVDSAPGAGSTFRLFLPPQRASLSSARPVAPGTIDPWRQSGHVLVVDDEEQVRSVLVAMLKVCGFTADAESDGAAAVERFRANPAGFDVVVLDLIMPGMNGEETLRAVRTIRPDIRVLIVSGYSEGDILSRIDGGRAVAFLAKPFTRTSLEDKLRELLT
jgi:CheY-like chemotaxis protein